MPHLRVAAILFGCLLLQGCSPTLNWRDVRLDQTSLLALFPCKPERGARKITLGAQVVTLTILACDASNAKFALAYVNTRDAVHTALVLDEWKSTTLSNIRTQSSREHAFVIKGANEAPQPGVVRADGQHADGTAVTVQALWFAAGTLLFQAAVYERVARLDVAETYFQGLRLQ